MKNQLLIVFLGVLLFSSLLWVAAVLFEAKYAPIKPENYRVSPDNREAVPGQIQNPNAVPQASAQ